MSTKSIMSRLQKPNKTPNITPDLFDKTIIYGDGLILGGQSNQLMVDGLTLQSMTHQMPYMMGGYNGHQRYQQPAQVQQQLMPVQQQQSGQLQQQRLPVQQQLMPLQQQYVQMPQQLTQVQRKPAQLQQRQQQRQSTSVQQTHRQERQQQPRRRSHLTTSVQKSSAKQQQQKPQPQQLQQQHVQQQQQQQQPMQQAQQQMYGGMGQASNQQSMYNNPCGNYENYFFGYMPATYPTMWSDYGNRIGAMDTSHANRFGMS